MHTHSHTLADSLNVTLKIRHFSFSANWTLIAIYLRHFFFLCAWVFSFVSSFFIFDYCCLKLYDLRIQITFLFFSVETKNIFFYTEGRNDRFPVRINRCNIMKEGTKDSKQPTRKNRTYQVYA